MELYHVTKSENVADIMKNGLVPSIGKYATEMGETQKAVWLFPRLEDAQEMIPVWLEPFYGSDLCILKINLPDDFPVEYTGSDYEVYVTETIRPEYITITEET